MDMQQIFWPRPGEPEAVLTDVTRDDVIEVLEGDRAFIAIHPVEDTMRIFFGPTESFLLVVVTLVRVSDDSFRWRIRQARRMSTAEIAWWREEIQK